jgi:signal transduction histidine kinase
MLDRALRELEHEINNPMASVLANLEFLRIDHPTQTDLDELDAVVKDIQTGMDRIRATVAWFVRLHRSGTKPLRFDLRAELTETVNHLTRRWGNRMRFHLDVEDVSVPSYGKQLAQVMVNIIKNTADLGSAGNVRITARREGDLVRIRFEDDGPGLPPEVLPHVFERGFTTKHERGAQGLGLYLSKTIVERHGGTISAASAPGGGAAFDILLPVWMDGGKPEPKTSGVRPLGTAGSTSKVAKR